MEIKPIIMINFRYCTLSGGYRRIFEIIKRGKSQGINYIIIIDDRSYKNALKMFPDIKKIFQKYKLYMIKTKEDLISTHGLKLGAFYLTALKRSIIKIVEEMCSRA